MNRPAIPSVAELKRLFAERGIRPNRRCGQSFLVDAAAMHFLVRSARLERCDVVLEAGAGTGGLTVLLAADAGWVVAAEVDRKLHAVAAEHLEPIPNVTLLHANVMGRGDRIAPAVRDAVRAALSRTAKSRFKVVANLPYQIGTAFLTAVLFGDPVPEDILLTVQREVADRICARPGSKTYGYFSVIVQAVAQASRLRGLSPKAFWPQPEVESAMLRIRPDPALRVAAGDVEALRGLAAALFRHRRKQVARALVTAELAPDREAARQLLSALDVPESVRPEELTVAQFIQLAQTAADAGP